MQIRDIVKQVYVYAIAHGEKVVNPADSVGPSSIATLRAEGSCPVAAGNPADGAATGDGGDLSDHQAGVAPDPADAGAQERTGSQATWDEVDFENATWTIPKQRMKGRNPHVVYLSRQALDIFVTLHARRRLQLRLSFSL